MDLTGRRGIAGALVNRRGGWGGGGDTREEKGEGGRLWWSNREAEEDNGKVKSFAAGKMGRACAGAIPTS